MARGGSREDNEKAGRWRRKLLCVFLCALRVLARNLARQDAKDAKEERQEEDRAQARFASSFAPVAPWRAIPRSALIVNFPIIPFVPPGRGCYDILLHP